MEPLLLPVLVIFGLLTAANVVQLFLLRRARHGLESQEAFLRTLVDQLPIGLAVRSMTPERRGRYVVWNATNVALFDVSADSALGRTIHEVMAPDLAAEVADLDAQMMAAPCVQERVHPREVPGRGRRWIQAKRAPILGPAGEVLYIVSTQLDVTDERLYLDGLRLASKVFETMVDGIMVTDCDDRVLMVNAAFTTITGFADVDVAGTIAGASAFRPVRSEEWRAHLEALQREGHVAGELEHVGKDGAPLSLWITATSVRDAAGDITNYVRVLTDISRLKDTQRRLEQLASFDGLTGLPNRRLLHYRLAQMLASAKRHHHTIAVLFIDLDRFKDVNDRLGHAMGDLLLREVAVRLEHCIRASDTAARWGGDEFAVILDGGRADARMVGERIVRAMAVAFEIEGRFIRIGASVGVALSDAAAGSEATILENADAAMFRAKREGGGRMCFPVDSPTSG